MSLRSYWRAIIFEDRSTEEVSFAESMKGISGHSEICYRFSATACSGTPSGYSQYGQNFPHTSKSYGSKRASSCVLANAIQCGAGSPVATDFIRRIIDYTMNRVLHLYTSAAKPPNRSATVTGDYAKSYYMVSRPPWDTFMHQAKIPSYPPFQGKCTMKTVPVERIWRQPL